ncbi:LacI family DNA-binding transcriptional regulator [Rhizobium laguerreae]|uniref:LacI family DNA-binding transcriptional regulator n=1 Tax=Rhizobium laguerreae TaxID=1076926 RepID=UPI001C90CF4C|nr:LacI family DNA-binding transcriptional regulator [Rhizobium laguerreae]MBY3381806.1 LacI family transcriptional regulator [Rhizobium laguerreae]
MSNLREVAQIAGVSKTTVSRVFSNPEVVNEATKKKVLEAARLLNWQPSQTARSLALGRTGNLGLLIPDISNPAFGPPVREAQNHARQLGFSLFIAPGDGQSDDDRAMVQALASKVDGLVLVAPRMSDEQLNDLQRTAPITLVNRISPGIPSAVVPTQDGMNELVDHLVKIGHTRIAFMAGPTYSESSRYREYAFLEAIDRSTVEGLNLGHFLPTFESGAQATDQILASRATAVIGYNDIMAIGLMNELHRRGIRPGAELAIAGFDGSWLCTSVSPALTSVAIPFAEAIIAAVDQVTNLILGESVSENRLLPSTLIVRDSTPSFTQRPQAVGSNSRLAP